MVLQNEISTIIHKLTSLWLNESQQKYECTEVERSRIENVMFKSCHSLKK